MSQTVQRQTNQDSLDQWELSWDLLCDAEYQRAVIGLRAGMPTPRAAMPTMMAACFPLCALSATGRGTGWPSPPHWCSWSSGPM